MGVDPDGGSDTPLAECQSVTKSVKDKANKNKHRARFATLSLAASAALIPVFIGLSGSHFVVGKLVPSALAAYSAIVASWLQIEKPHERWMLYRRYQRRLESEQLRFRFGIAPYDVPDPEAELAKQVAQLQLDLHDEWEGLLPRREQLEQLMSESRRNG